MPLIPLSIVAVQKFAKLAKYWGIYTGLGDSFLKIFSLTTLKIYEADAEEL